jgi:hypothetical protein
MSDTTEMTRQAFCARMGISESTVRRLELDGMPCTPVGRSKRYNLVECKTWLRANENGQKCQSGQISKGVDMRASWLQASAYIESSKLVHRRVMPSSLKLI